jgi:hypothetical protein
MKITILSELQFVGVSYLWQELADARPAMCALCINNMKTLIIIFVLFWSSLSHASPIECKVTDGRTVVVTMDTPHPKHALVYRPDGETVWLQTSSEFIHKRMALN